MSTVTVVVPDFGYEISEAAFVRFLVKPGDAVSKGALLAEISTDKTVIEIDAPCDGSIAVLAALSENDTVIVGQTLVDISSSEPLGIVGVDAPTPSPPAIRDTSTHPLATRGAKLLAKTHGIDLATITGTGPDGRITENDVENHALGAQKPTTENDGFLPLDPAYAGMYRHMSDQAHMSTATVSDVVNITAWWPKKKRELMARVIDAMTTAVDISARVNATYKDSMFRPNTAVNIAIAVDTEPGLLVPVLRNCEKLERLDDVTAAINALSQKARDGALTPADTRGATIALSNFGAFGFGITGQMVIPRGLACIVGIGRVLERPVPDTLEGIKKVSVLPISITFDHRYLTGGDVCRFGAAIRDALESRH